MPKLDWDTRAVTRLFELAVSDRKQARLVLSAILRFERDQGGDTRMVRGMDKELRLRISDWRVIIDVSQGHRIADIVLRRDAYD